MRNYKLYELPISEELLAHSKEMLTHPEAEGAIELDIQRLSVQAKNNLTQDQFFNAVTHYFQHGEYRASSPKDKAQTPVNSPIRTPNPQSINSTDSPLRTPLRERDSILKKFGETPSSPTNKSPMDLTLDSISQLTFYTLATKQIQQIFTDRGYCLDFEQSPVLLTSNGLKAGEGSKYYSFIFAYINKITLLDGSQKHSFDSNNTPLLFSYCYETGNDATGRAEIRNIKVVIAYTQERLEIYSSNKKSTPTQASTPEKRSPHYNSWAAFFSRLVFSPISSWISASEKPTPQKATANTQQKEKEELPIEQPIADCDTTQAAIDCLIDLCWDWFQDANSIKSAENPENIFRDMTNDSSNLFQSSPTTTQQQKSNASRRLTF